MTPAEQIADDTWGRIKQSWDVNVRLGEETLTDLLALDFTRSMKDRAKLFQCTNAQESKRGTDLEIRIHAGGNRATAFAVQAKKLDRSQRYDHLNAKVKSSDCSQIDILEMYSQRARAIPLYLLYNYVRRDDIRPYWHCCRCPDESQLGCTLVPSWIIHRAITTRGRRNFDSIHTSCAALPWRCLFDCPQERDHRLLTAARCGPSMFRESFLRSDNARRYDWVSLEPVDGGWPEWLWYRDDGTLSDEDVERVRQDSGVSATVEARTPNFRAGELPGYLILVKEEMG